jgi:fatty-acyl-CoA synthase
MPHERLGEVPVAYVVLADACSATEEELIAFAAAQIPERAAVPKQIFIIDEMPMTAVNKVFKPALRELAAAAAVSEALSSVVARATGISIVPATIDGQAGAEILLPTANDTYLALEAEIRESLRGFAVPVRTVKTSQAS